MSKLSDLHIEQQESGESHSPTERVSRAKEEYCKIKVEWYVDEFAKVGEKRSLSELATGLIGAEKIVSNMSYTLFLNIYDNVLGDLLFDAKLNKDREIMNDLVNKESGESHSPIELDRKDLPNYLAIKSREIAYEKKVSTNSILKPMLIEHGFEDKDGVALEPYSILVDYYEDLDKIPQDYYA